LPIGAAAGFPLSPFAPTVTVKACAVEMLNAEGVTATVGLVFAKLGNLVNSRDEIEML
jgi:hypothetical protein